MTQTATPEDARPLSPAEAARIANVSRKTVYREIDRGALPAQQVGRQLRIDPTDFRMYRQGRRMTLAADRHPSGQEVVRLQPPEPDLDKGLPVSQSSPAGCRASRLRAQARSGLEHFEGVA